MDILDDIQDCIDSAIAETSVAYDEIPESLESEVAELHSILNSAAAKVREILEKA